MTLSHAALGKPHTWFALAGAATSLGVVAFAVADLVRINKLRRIRAAGTLGGHGGSAVAIHNS